MMGYHKQSSGQQTLMPLRILQAKEYLPIPATVTRRLRGPTMDASWWAPTYTRQFIKIQQKTKPNWLLGGIPQTLLSYRFHRMVMLLFIGTFISAILGGNVLQLTRDSLNSPTFWFQLKWSRNDGGLRQISELSPSEESDTSSQQRMAPAKGIPTELQQHWASNFRHAFLQHCTWEHWLTKNCSVQVLS